MSTAIATLPRNFTPSVPGLASAPVATDVPRDGLTAVPEALLWPLGAVFEDGGPLPSENFLAGLHAEGLLGARTLPPAGPRCTPLAWIGIALRRGARSLFAELRGGCWVRGFPVVGSACELLRAAGLADLAALGAALRELGQPGETGANLYFTFHDYTPAAGCARVYLLDADARRLHGFALPASALAQSRAK